MSVDVVLNSMFLHYYRVEFRQKANVHLVMVGSDGKPKPVSFSRLAEIDVLCINLVIKQDLIEKQYVFILKEHFLEIHAKGLSQTIVSRKLEEFKDLLTNQLLEELPPAREVDYKIELVPGIKIKLRVGLN